MTTSGRQALIARYKAGYGEVVEALEDIASEELDWRAAPGEWSAREVVHHLADSETIAGIRFRRLLTEESPVIQGYDEGVYARRLRYAERPMEPALQALRGLRPDVIVGSSRDITIMRERLQSDEEDAAIPLVELVSTPNFVEPVIKSIRAAVAGAHRARRAATR